MNRFNFHLRTAASSTLAVCLLALPAGAQDQIQTQVQVNPVLSLDRLVLSHYEPQHADADDLAEVVSKMVGRQFYVEERGGLSGRPVTNITTLGSSVIIYDTEAYVMKVRQALTELDQPDGRSARRAPIVLEILEYAPRYITLQAIEKAIGPFGRSIEIDRGQLVDNISKVEDRGLVIVRDTRETLDGIASLLQRIDTPAPQVMLTCYLIRGDGDGNGDGKEAETNLPADLLQHLGKLVPQFAFEPLGFGLIRTSVGGGGIKLQMDTASSSLYELAFYPVAFDALTGSMSVQECSLIKRTTHNLSQGGGVLQTEHRSEQIFSTSAVLRGGEYTVLGAAGREPIFVVLRLTTL